MSAPEATAEGKTLPPLVLASASPRRRHYFDCFFPGHTVLPAECDERPAPGEMPSVYVRRMAREKALDALRRAPEGAVVAAADTIVVLDGQVLGKPADAEDAKRMLRMLSGRVHLVATAYHIQQGLAGGARRVTGLVTTKVVFRELDEREIGDYVASGEPMGKAGAYACQGAATAFILRFRGSGSNVVGLPMAEVIAALAKFGYRPSFRAMA